MRDQPDATAAAAVYGAPPPGLTEVSATASQVSPVFPGIAGEGLESFAPGSLKSITIVAPPGTLERRYVLAAGLRALSADGALTAMARKDRGGARLRKELESFGCIVSETAKSHYRMCACPAPVAAIGVEDALAAGGPQYLPSVKLWSQPGVFSWDRIDPGSAILARSLPQMSGCGADLGCGIGVLAGPVLASSEVGRLILIDQDRRAVDAARRNVDDHRVEFRWADALADDGGDADGRLTDLDFIVMNPPFHAAGTENRTLGQAFIRRAMGMLRPGGACWIVANRHLPYEGVLRAAASKVGVVIEQGGYKVFEACR